MENDIPQIAWLTLSSAYYVAPDAPADNLINDASMLLETAQGITRLIADSFVMSRTPDLDNVGSALGGLSVLIDMALSCTRHAQLNAMREMRHAENRGCQQS